MVPDGNEEYLARRAQQGDREAFLRLYDLYLDKVYNRVKGRVPSQYVEDVTQDIFVSVARSIPRFRQRSRFGTWLYTIVNRRIADFYRQYGRYSEQRAVSLKHGEHLPSEPPFESEYSEECALMRRALNNLKPDYQNVILLRFADGLTFAEIAEQRGQTLEAVKSSYRRAIQALRDDMGAQA